MNNYTQKWIIIHKCDKRCLPIVHWTSTIELSALYFMHIYSRFVYNFVFLFTFVYNYSFPCIKWKCIIIHCPSRFVQSSLHIARRPPILALRALFRAHRALHRGQSSSGRVRKNGTTMGTVLRIVALFSFVLRFLATLRRLFDRLFVVFRLERCGLSLEFSDFRT